MGIFRKQTVRAPWTTVLLVLLLALAIAASSIGFAAWTSAGKQAETIEQQYTTIAIPKEQEIDRYELGGTTYEDGSIEWGDGQWYYPPSVVEKKSAVLPQVVTTDRRCLLGAQVKGIPSLTSGRLDILQYNEAMDSYAYNLCVLAVKCIKCDIFSEPGYQDESGTFDLAIAMQQSRDDGSNTRMFVIGNALFLMDSSLFTAYDNAEFHIRRKHNG